METNRRIIKLDSFYTIEELNNIGFNEFGANVLVSRKASIYGASSISLGSNVRIDDFCILSGTISIGNYIHIAAYSALYGGIAGINIADFSNLSSRITIYALSDDYSGESMTNPMVPEEYKKIQHSKVQIHRHTIIGSGSIILPGISLGEGCSIGALSMVNHDLPEWSICAGIPAKVLRLRSKKLLNLEAKFLLREM